MKILRIVLLLPWLAGCGKDAGYRLSDFNFPQTSEVQFVNLMYDSPTIASTLVSSTTGATSAGASESFGGASSQLSVVVGEYTVGVSYLDADNNRQFLLNQTVTYTDQDQLVYLLMGSVTSPTEQTIQFTDPFFTGGIPAGSIEVWFANGASAPDQVDLYLTGPTTPLEATTPTTTLASYGYSEAMTLNTRAGWRLRVTPHDSTEVLFDSGTFTMTDGTRTLLAVTDYFGPEPASQSPSAPLLSAVRVGTSGAGDFPSGDLPSDLRLINLIRDVPAVDVYFGSTSASPVFDNIAQSATTPYQSLDPGAYALNLTLHGIKDQFLLEKDLTFGSGKYYTLVLTGSSADGTISSVSFASDPRPIVGRTTVNFINAGSVNADVNLYLLDPGQAVGDNSPLVSAAVPNTLRTVTLHSGMIDAVVTSADNKNIIAGPTRIVLDEGKTYSLVLVEDPVVQATSARLLVLEDTAG